MRSHAITLAVLLLAVCTLNAATINTPSDADLTRRADLVAVATVESSSTRVAAGLVMTDYRLTVDEVVKGAAQNGETIVVAEFGGFANGRGTLIPGSATYREGEQVLAFLRMRDDGTWFTASMAAGKFRLERGTDGIRYAVREDEHFDDGVTALPADDFVGYVRELVAGRESKRPAQTAAMTKAVLRPAPNATAAQYTLKTGFPVRPVRWIGCENSATCDIGVWINGTQGTLDSTGAVTRGRNAWENEPNSGVNFSNQGTSFITTASDDNTHVVLFNSNASGAQGLCDGTDGCAIGWVDDAVHTYNGEQFYSIVGFDIIIRPTVSGQTRLDGLVAHEFGHILGIRHSNDGTPSATGALMTNPFPGGVGANLQLWDREAVATVYGNGLPCEPAAIASTSGAGNVAFNGNANLSVVATGTVPLTYQWYQGSAGDTSRPVGQNQPNYRTDDLQTTTNFWVKVSNACGNANSGTITVTVTPCNVPAITTQPVSQRIAPNATATLSVAHTGTTPMTYFWYQGAVGNVSNQVGNQQTFTTPALSATTTYWVRVRNTCGQADSQLTTITVGNECLKPTIVDQPQSKSVLVGASTDVVFGVRATGDEPFTYQWYEGQASDTSKPIANATTSSLTVKPPYVNVEVKRYWVRVTNACGSADSATASIDVQCGPVPTPVLFVPATVSTPRTNVTLRWTVRQNLASSYEVQEADNPSFTNPKTFPPVVGRTELTFQSPTVASDTRVYYRVRGIAACNGVPGEYSLVSSTVYLKPQPSTSSSFSMTAPVGSTGQISQELFIPGFSTSGKTASADGDSFTVTEDQPWMTVSPQSGPLPAGGVTVVITMSLSGLPAGASMGSVTVQRTQAGTGGGGNTGVSDTKKSTVPISVSLVTPITPTPRDQNAGDETLIIPSVGHVDGFNSRFQSDIRLANTWTDALDYLLTFTPTQTDGTKQGTQTLLSVSAGETKGLNDVVKEWYGAGIAGSPGLGTLEIKPVVPNGVEPATISRVTVASSRTYNVSDAGTFGQYIPALPISQFIRNIASDASARISLQQIAQSAAYRTNVGFVEGSGQGAQVMASLFDAAGTRIKDVIFNLGPYEQRQLALTDASLFPGVSLTDGRLEVTVVSDTGKVSAYASTLDNKTNDPLLVLPVQPSKLSAKRFVLPGVAELDNGAANFHTDMRIFNAATTQSRVTLHYYPQGNAASPAPVTMTLQPGEVKSIDNTLLSLWNISGSGGAVAVVADVDTPLVVTGRTFSRDANGGTYGQFIPAVAGGLQAIAEGDRAIEIVQLEQSDSFRTNVGLIEVTGSPVAVRLTGFSPDARVSSFVDLVLNPNEFRQLNAVFSQLAFPATYNGRVSVKVIGGSGKVSAYGSIIDNRTQDPTYIPAQ